MAKKIKSEKDIKALLKIDDWKDMPKEKIMDFVSLIPNMDREVSLAAIEQFPNYVTMSNNIVSSLIKLCDNSSKEIGKGTDKCLDVYRLVLDNLSKQLNDESLSLEDKKMINEQMIDIANKMSTKDSEKNQIISTIVNNGQKIMVGVLVVGAAILGVNAYKNKDKTN